MTTQPLYLDEFCTSFAQQRLWFLEQYEQGTSRYHMPVACRVKGELDEVALEAALNDLVERHEVLRTTFAAGPEGPVQRIAEQLHITLAREGLAGADEARVQARIRQEAQAPFDLAQGPLLRATVLRLSADERIVLLTLHHITSDGWSMAVLLRELGACYRARLQGAEPALPELAIQYADYAVWQREWLQGEVLQRQLDHWRRTLQGAPAVLELPTDHPRPAQPRRPGAVVHFQLDAALAGRLQRLGQPQQASLFMTLAAALNVLLHRYSQQDDLCIGYPVANRQRAEVEGLIGFFVNTLVLRTRIRPGDDFHTLLRQVREAVLEADAHQDLPFEKLVEELKPQRSLNQTPLFQVMLAFYNADHAAQLDLPGLSTQVLDPVERTAKFDLSFEISLQHGQLQAGVEYDSELYERASIERLAAHYRRVLELVAETPECPVGQLPLLSEAEHNQQLVTWNATRTAYPEAHEALHQLVERQAQRSPQAVALVHEGGEISYEALNRRANQLAHHLRAQGIGADTRVAVCLQRSPEMVVALLGILKAGAAYVPLDPAHPRQRLAYMLADTASPLLITQQGLLDHLAPLDVPVLCLDRDAALLDAQAEHDPQHPVHPDQLAYCIYTSGSTGQPKGAMNSHRAIVNRLLWMQAQYRLDTSDTVLQKTPYTFDVSVWEFFWPLMTGARLAIAPSEAHKDPQQLAHTLRQHRVTTAHFVPAMLQAFLAQSQAALPALRRVFASGEALPATVQRQFRQRHPQVELHNLYGPTEAAVDVSHWACTDDSDPVPIGRPVANTRLYVLDAQLQPVPVGVTAELYIAGVQLARGYLGRPELTAERFLPDPHGEPGSRMYRTGDLARYRADGSIEYHGRTDHQVKLRGLRIELGEIENTLLGLPGVREAVVLAREEPGGTRLVGYVALHDPDEPGVEARLQQQLLAQLPEYMVPASWVVLSALPLNANGKIDRKALPEPQDRAAGQAHVEPESDTQRLLAGLWRELLHTERVGLHDNFFALGGHSLMATQLVSRLREARGIELPLRAVFEAPVLAQLAARVEAEQAAATRNDAIASHGAAPGEHPLSFAQERLFFLDQLEPGSAAYNIPMALRLRGALDAPALERALDTVVRRHAALRTSFAHDAAGHVVAVVHAEPLAPLQFADLSAFADAEGAMRLQAAEASSAPFDLQRGPLLRTRLLRLRADEHVLLLTLHHVVADAWSIGVLVREVLALYAAFSAGQASPLSDLPIQYPDFARWQREWLSGERLQAQTAFWTTTLAGAPATLELPTDRPRPALQTFAGATLERGLGRALSAQIDALAQAHGTTPFMTLLAAFNVLLARHAQQDDIVVGSPVANRTRRETEPLIGFFVNTLALRTQLDGNPRFSDLLDRVRQSTLAAYAHQDLPFEQVVDALKLPRDLGRSPLFQVMFTLKNTDMPAFDIAGLTAEPVPVESGAARFDLMLELSPGPRGYVGHWEYNRDLFDAATIERMAGHFEVLLAAATAAPDTRIAALPLMTAAERRQVLGTWNATAQPFRQVPVHELFRETAQRHPDLLAAISAEGALSYDQLNRRSNQLARYLRRLGVRPHSLVGLCLERSLDVAVAVLGILKAGAACVPMDASYPVERLRFMARDAGAPVIVTQTPLRDRVGDCDAAFICMDACDEAWREADTDEPHDLPLLALCYVIYTSGSTGQPKGAALTHEMLTNLAQWQLTESALGVGDRTLQFSPLSFDVSFDEMVSTWAAAGTLVMVSEETRRDPVQLLHLVMRERVARLFIPFVALQGIADAARELPHPGALREIVCGGEQLQVTDEVVAMYRKIPGGLLHNQYGPTESHFVTGHRLEDEPGDWPRLPPIGKPLFNCRMYVLDAQLEPVPAGVRGDLYIAGLHLARGYWKRPDMTAERFVPDPFAPTPGERMYRTGDVARYLPDGSIEYLGRTDHQVKIRGFRIELAEVEQALMAFDSVAAGAATVREDRPGVKKLVGYVVAKPGASADLRALRDWLAARLPDYMVPSALVALPALPQTPSGKIDRRALPAPADDEAAQARHVAPEGALEEAIARIWSDVLGVPRVGALDGFFELGGHSLLATRVVSRLRIELGLTLPLRLLFEAPTVRQLAQALSTQPAAAASPAAGPAAGGTALASALTPDRTWPEGSPWPLSYAQQRLWFIEQLAPGLPTYNVPLALRLQGPLDAAALQRALDAIAARHLLLGARVRPGSAEPLFEQRGQGAWPCITEVLAAGPEQEARLRQRLADEARRSFDLATGPLVRAHLFVLSADTRVLLLNMLHIVTDGWSIGVLARELQALYGAFAQGQPDPLPALPLQYRDYATWQRRQSGRLSDSLAWWKSELDGLPVVHALPLDRPRPTALGTEGATVLHWLPRATQQGLEALCHQRSASLFMGLHALLATLIARYSGQDDIAIGTPVANRDDAELAPLIGLFVNTVVLRTRLGAAASFDECLAHSRNTALQAFSHQQVPFEHVVDALQPERSLSHAPLFQVMLALQNNDHAVPELPGLRTTLEPVGDTTARFDLTINAVPGRDGLALHWEYNTALFDRATVEQMALHFERLADAAIAQPQVPVAHLPLLKAAERAAEVHPAGRMLADYPVPHCLHELFEQQVARRPDAVAVSCGSQSWTYRELDERANRLARHLVERGVGPDTLVGLCMGRSLAMIEGLLAILKAGGAYVPLDPQYPPARLHYMLGNSAVRVLLTQTEWRESLTLPDSIEALCLDDEAQRAAWARQPATRIEPASLGLRPSHLAYVIYTSGSTGQPKGVPIEHRQVARLLSGTQAWFGFDHRGVWTVFHSLAFDFSVWEIWGALALGGRAVIVPREVAQSPQHFLQLLESERVTVLNQTPTAFRGLVGEVARRESLELALRHVVFGGEALHFGSLAAWYQRLGDQSPRLVNMYGITETTVHVTYRPLSKADVTEPASLIGEPIGDLALYLLDPHGQPVPRGVVGEMYVGGAGVGRGYLHNPALTQERFVADPFNPAGGRMYRTGDLARRRRDGGLEYMGRIDHQVKVRGFRIELGEIEAALSRAPGVASAVVLARRQPGGEGQRLLGYVVPHAGAQPSTAALRAWLKSQLPEHMVPAGLAIIDSLPVTANGKIDMQELPEPQAEHGTAALAQPQTPTEHALCALWREVLRVPHVSPHDNFFALGGDSMLAVSLVHAAREAGLVLSVRELFQHQSVAELARHLAGRGGAPDRPAPAPDWQVPAELGQRADLEAVYPLTAMQAQMVRAYRDPVRKGEGVYHAQMWSRVRQPGHRAESMQQAIDLVVARQPVLRTVLLQATDGSTWQGVKARHRAVLRLHDWRGLANDLQREQVNALVAADRHEPLFGDSDDGGGQRFHWVELSDDEFLMLVSIHHAIDDGWGNQHFLSELWSLYRRLHAGEAPGPLEPAKHVFIEHVAIEREAARSTETRSFWRAASWPASAALDLLPPPTAPHEACADVESRLPATAVQTLRDRATAWGVSTKALVLSAYLATLESHFQRPALTVGVVANGRSERLSDPSTALGLFWNLVPFTAKPHVDPCERARHVHAALIAQEPHTLFPLQATCAMHGVRELFSATFNFTQFHHAFEGDSSAGIAFNEFDWLDRFEYPLNCHAALEGPNGLRLRFSSDPRRVEPARVRALSEELLRALT
jgi:amino acid adenylation domain-containing protein